MRSLTVDEVARDEHWKAGVQMARGFEAPVQRLLHVFPQRPAVGLDDHCAAHRAIVGKVGAQHKCVVPLVEIFAARDELVFSHVLRFWRRLPEVRSSCRAGS